MMKSEIKCSLRTKQPLLQTLSTSAVNKEKARWELHKDAACCFEQILEAAPHKAPLLRPFTSCFTKSSKKDEQDMLSIAGKIWTHK